MALTGPVLQWGTAVVALLAAALVVATWARLGRPGPLAVLARCAALAGVNALVLLAVLVTANDEFSFYSDYQDLLGVGGTTTVTTSGAIGASSSTAPSSTAPSSTAPGSTAPSSTGPAAPAPVDRGVPVPGTGGRVERLVVGGPPGTSGAALVLLPAGYADPADAARTYPVIEAFHGYPGTPEQWLGAMDLQHWLDAAVADHRLAPTLVVVLDLVALARTAPPPVAVWATTGRTDPLSYPSTAQFAAAARAPLAVTALVTAHGGHRTTVWVPQLGQALAWLGSTEPGFAPAP